MYIIQDVYGWAYNENKLHQTKINFHYSIWNNPSKVHKWRESKDNKQMSIYRIDKKIDNGHWI